MQVVPVPATALWKKKTPSPPPSLASINIIINSNCNNSKRRRRGGRRRHSIGSLKITAASLKRAVSFAMSLRDLLSQTAPLDPFNLLRLPYGGDGGGRGGGVGFPIGGSGGDWFGKRRRAKINGLVGILLFSMAIGSFVLGFGKKADLELGIRVFVPAVLGFKIRIWRHWIGLLMTFGLAFFCLYRRRENLRRRWW